MEDTDECPAHFVLQLISGRWTPHILWILSTKGPTRFGDLRRALPGRASAKVVTESLKRMERHGVVTRTPTDTVPPEVTYALTEKGRDFDRVLRAFEEVADKWRDDGAV